MHLERSREELKGGFVSMFESARSIEQKHEKFDFFHALKETTFSWLALLIYRLFVIREKALPFSMFSHLSDSFGSSQNPHSSGSRWFVVIQLSFEIPRWKCLIPGVGSEDLVIWITLILIQSYEILGLGVNKI